MSNIWIFRKIRECGLNSFNCKDTLMSIKKRINEYMTQGHKISNDNNTNKTHRSDISQEYNLSFPVIVDALPIGYGILPFVLGILGTAVLGPITVSFLVSLISSFDHLTLITTSVMTVITIFCILLTINGFKSFRIQKHFERYIMLIDRQKYIRIGDIAAAFPLNKKLVAKELNKLISIGVFPEAFIDQQKKYFLGDNEAYHLYMHSLEVEREMSKDPDSAQKLEQIRNAVELGREYINDIYHAKDIITDSEFSEDLNITGLILKNIFDRLEMHPELMPEARKLLEYYLPTVRKLLNTYIEFDRQNIDSENIRRSRAEIKKSIKSINTAFYNLYNSLFAGDKVDIVSDINVLNAMFAQEGLTGNDFKKQEEQKK